MTSSSKSHVPQQSDTHAKQPSDQQQHPLVSSPSLASLQGSSGNDSPCDPVMIQQQLEVFLRDGVYESAQLLGELLIALAMAPLEKCAWLSATASGEDVRAFHARSCYLFAELLVAKREFKRAIQYYKRHWKLKMANANSAVTAEAVEVKAKIAKCWVQLENPHQAIEMLNSIPAQVRSLSVNLMLGKLYLYEGLKNKAEESYTMALRQNPYALEATLVLTDLAASKETSSIAAVAATSLPSGDPPTANSQVRQREIERFYAKLSTLRPPNKCISRVDATWMQVLVNAHTNAKRGRYRASMDAYESLEKVFPNNLHCLLQKGKLEMDHEFYHQAHLNFHKARQVDDQNVTMMDFHADCLRKNNARTQLNNLVHDLFDTSDSHTESWLAAAYYSDMKGEHETALQFCERAIMTNRRYAPAHLFRGTLLLTLHRPEHALVSFTTSCKLAKTLDAYAGMISSYCDLCLRGVNKYKEAVTTAKSVVKLFPHKAQSYTLLGSVFALRPEMKEHARKAFERALTLEPRKLAAMFGLVDLLVHDGNFVLAIDKLVVLSEQYPRDEVFTKLADVYTLNKQFADAMTQYHRSLSVNPASVEALRGLDRLEKLMRGEDPDEVMNSTMEHMDPDEQEDSMEAGEYIAS